ncbi:MAG: hypothetical protein WC971_04385 [Coriobacteriia bacterium]
MPETPPALYVVETLTAGAWLRVLLPFLARARRTDGRPVLRYIDASGSGLALARATARLAGASVEPFHFRMVDVRDEQGRLIRLRTAYSDYGEVSDEILRDPAFERVLRDPSTTGRLPLFLTKRLAAFDFFNATTVWRALYLTQVVVWKRRVEGLEGAETVLFINRSTWQPQVEAYGAHWSVRVVPARVSRGGAKNVVRRVFGTRFLQARSVWDSIADQGVAGTLRSMRRRSAVPSQGEPKLAVEYYGQLNLDRPELYCDAFFWQRSEELRGEDVLLTFNTPGDPLDPAKWAEIAGHGMSAIALTPRARTAPEAPVFYHWRRVEDGPVASPVSRGSRDPRGRWLEQEVAQYRAEHDRWYDLFTSTGSKLYVSWFKYVADHCVIADAMEAAGGATAIYQRALEEFPSPEQAIGADVAFCFAPQSFDIEARQGSEIPYLVVTGYVGDHRFPLLKAPAAKLRERVLAAGASRVLAFFDENSAADDRWHTGDSFMRVNYEFILGRLLADPTLGLVLKPKVPGTLRRRLGPVAELLEAAIATGRCLVLERGAMHGSYPPAIAALAADIAIHGHLCAATAGFEAALVGVPTLLLDREGWPGSRLHALDGTVAFPDWPELWAALEEHLRVPGGTPGFGDWSPLLPELDPFRDGRAAERMGTYLAWLLDGFREGMPRESVLERAAERYAGAWGADKVARVGSRAWAPLTSPSARR